MSAQSPSKFSFSLISEPFIRCTMADGSPAEFGLRETLLRASEIREISDDSPLVILALHRLLLAILHHALQGPRNKQERFALLQAGRFHVKIIEDYFEKWEERFDLFDETHPFYQAAGFQTKEPSSINRLAQELSRGNNAALFDHTMDDPPPSFSPAQAARVVIAEQVFAVGGGKSDTGNTTHSPVVSGALVLARGRSLFETLCLNLTLYTEADPIPSLSEDAPVWELKPVRPDQQSSVANGYLDYLTWQSRTLRLHPEQDAGVTVVRRVSYAQGRRFEADPFFRDPMIAYKKDKDGLKTIRFSEHRALWRDGAALFQFAGSDDCLGPATLHSLASIPVSILPRSRIRFQLSLFGLCTDKAKVLYWRHETLPLRLQYLESPLLVDALKTALALTESVYSEALRKGIWAMVSNRLAGSENSNPDTDRVRAGVNSLQTDQLYWSRLEPEFRRFLDELADHEDNSDDQVTRWFASVVTPCARRAFEDTVKQFDSGRDLKAVNRGRAILNGQLKQINSNRLRLTSSGVTP